MNRALRLAAIVMTVALAACNSVSSAPSSTTSPPTATTVLSSTTSAQTTAPPTTTVPPPTTSAQTTAPPASEQSITAPTDQDLLAAVNALQVRGDKIWSDPATADLSAFCVPESACSDRRNPELDEMARQGLRVDGLRFQPVTGFKGEVNRISTEQPDLSLYEVTCTLDSSVTLGQITNSEGEVVYNIVNDESTVEYILEPWPADPELPWRFAK